jgi:hypothetical protein
VDESYLSCGTGCRGLFRRGDGSWIIGFSGFLEIMNNTFVELMMIYHGLRQVKNMEYA